jgi:hypothetical protein
MPCFNPVQCMWDLKWTECNSYNFWYSPGQSPCCQWSLFTYYRHWRVYEDLSALIRPSLIGASFGRIQSKTFWFSFCLFFERWERNECAGGWPRLSVHPFVRPSVLVSLCHHDSRTAGRIWIHFVTDVMILEYIPQGTWRTKELVGWNLHYHHIENGNTIM